MDWISVYKIGDSLVRRDMIIMSNEYRNRFGRTAQVCAVKFILSRAVFGHPVAHADQILPIGHAVFAQCCSTIHASCTAEISLSETTEHWSMLLSDIDFESI